MCVLIHFYIIAQRSKGTHYSHIVVGVVVINIRHWPPPVTNMDHALSAIVWLLSVSLIIIRNSEIVSLLLLPGGNAFVDKSNFTQNLLSRFHENFTRDVSLDKEELSKFCKSSVAFGS